MTADQVEIPVLAGQVTIDEVLEDPCCEECWAWRTGEVGR